MQQLAESVRLVASTTTGELTARLRRGATREPVDQRHAIGAVDRSQEITGAGIEGVDGLVAEVSNQLPRIKIFPRQLPCHREDGKFLLSTSIVSRLVAGCVQGQCWEQ